MTTAIAYMYSIWMPVAGAGAGASPFDTMNAATALVEPMWVADPSQLDCTLQLPAASGKYVSVNDPLAAEVTVLVRVVAIGFV